MDNCIFCKIVKGEIPARKVYEDENTLAFLDITPNTKGHSLVIPKTHVTDIYEIEPEKFAAVAKAAKKVAGLLKEKLGADACNLVQSNGEIAEQDVFHLHMHVIPRYSKDSVSLWMGVKEEKKKSESLNLDEILKQIIE